MTWKSYLQGKVEQSFKFDHELSLVGRELDKNTQTAAAMHLEI